MKKIKISVVIPTFNSKKTLLDTVDSILKQTKKPYEVIVVDNASTDGTTSALKKRFSKVKIISLKENTGVTGGRNAGILSVSKNSDYVFFFDHDMVADKNMLTELLEIAEGKKKIGIVTPKIYYWKKGRSQKRIWSAGTGINLWTGQVLFRGGKDIGQYESTEEVQVAPAAMLVKRQVLNKIHGFDDRYFATFEDTDFCFRARRAGFKTYYAPKAIAWHKISTKPEDEARRLLTRAYWVGRNRVLFMGEFGKSFVVFFIFSFVYSLYYFQISLRHNLLKKYLSYLKGLFAGFYLSWIQKFLVFIPFSYMWMLRKVVSCNCKTVLDLGCGHGSLSKLIMPKKKKIVGVELDSSSCLQAKISGFYQDVYLADVLDVNNIFNKKFDLVFSSQVLEHLPKKKGLESIKKWFNLTNKRLVITTTVGFVDYDPINKSDEKINPLQKHNSGWSVQEMEELCFTVRGQGAKFIYGKNGLSRRFPKLTFFWIFLSVLVSPFLYFSPEKAMYMICFKDKK